MNLTLKSLYTTLIFFIIIIETTGIDSDGSSPDENPRPSARSRIVKTYSGARHEPIICTGEGFVKDPHNCAMFYRCMKSGNNKYTIFRFQCGPGTIYDPDHEVCNHPQSTTRSECGGATHINDIQDNMSNEIPSPMVSSKPIHSSNTLHKTTIMNVKETPPSHAVSSTTTLYTTSTSASPYPWASSINPINDNHNLHKTTVKLLDTETKNSRDNICTSDGFMRDNENCRKFYRCVTNQSGGFTKYEFMCSEPTVWDEINQICNHVWAVKKSRCSLYDEKFTDANMQLTTEKLHKPEKNKMEVHIKENTKENTVHTIQQQLQISYGTNVTQSQTQIGNGFVKQNQTQVNYGDRLNQKGSKGSKQNQTQISHGSAISQSQIQIDYGNKGVQTQLQIDHSKDASQNQIQISETSTTKASTTIWQSENQEEHKPENTHCTEDGFIGDINDCRKFYRCVNNGQGSFKKFEFNCADGTAWDPSIKSCNHIWAVKGCNLHGSIGSSPHTVTTTIYKTTQSYHTTMSTDHTAPQPIEDYEDSDSSSYGNPKPVSIHTPLSSTTITTIHDSNRTECLSNGFVGDNNDCKIFYRCVENGNGGFTKHIFKCGEGTLWDPEIKACNHAWAVVKCGGNISPDINKVETTTDTTKTSTPIYIQSTTATHLPTTSISFDGHEFDEDNLAGYGPSNNEIQTTITSSKRPPIWDHPDNICKSSGYTGDKYDCKKFYRCVDNGHGGFTYYEYSCSIGTLWDTRINACNDASAVDRCSATTNKPKDQDGNTDNELETTKYITTLTPSITTTTTKSLPADEKCTQSGFMGDLSDCKRFYRCVDDGNGSYIRYEFMCGEGTLWDQELQSCNYAWAVTKCGSNSESLPINNELNHQNPPNVTADTEISSTTSAFPTSIDTTKQETASELCVSGGFFGDTKHCEKFYRCVDNGEGNFTRYEFVCGEGTVWDQSLKACNHRWAVKECNSTKNTTTSVSSEGTTEYSVTITTSLKYEDSPVTPHVSEILLSKNDSSVICTKEGFIADRKSCKSFYRCVNDGKGGLIKYQYSCGEGTYWNQEILSCDHITSNQICEPEHSFTTKLPHIQEEIIPEMTTISRDDTHEQESKPMQESKTCTYEGFYGDQHDCRKYYTCVNDGKGGFTIFHFSCGEGTSWDKQIQACNHESFDRCANFTSGSFQTTENPSQQEEGAMTSEKHNTSSTSLEQCELEGFFAVPNDCKKFIRCVSNNQGGFIKYEFACSEGTVWVQEMLTCYHDTGEAYCSPQIMTKPVTNEPYPQPTENYAPSSSEHISDKLNDKNESSTIKPPSNSASTCLSEGYYPDEKECRRFYQCVDNGKGAYTKYEHICGEGTAWDATTHTCTHIDQVSSCKESVMNDANNTQTTESSRSTTQGSTSSTISTTTSRSHNSNSHTTDICTSEGYFGNTQDCKKFYRCVNDGKGGYTKYDFTCADGTIWDKDIPICNHPENVANPSCNQNTTTGNSTTNTTESNENQSEASKTPENNSINCTKAGFYPDPNDCKKFYRCVDWDGNETKFSIFHFECGEGTIWDPAVDTCNHEDSVYPPRNCSGSQSSVTEETTTTEEESTTKSSTQATTQSLTESTTQSTTESTNQSTTESATTESAAQTTTERKEESTTEQSGESTTDRSGEGSTEQSTESTTDSLGESTTEYLGATTTEQSGETTTEHLGENTTKESVESTTRESTTEKLEQSTTEKLEESTTEQSTEITTKESIENTTTEGSVQTTTEQIETTESGTDSSTHKPTGSDCPKTENDQNLFVCPSSFRRHPKYCNLFYQCDENEESHELKIAVFTCPNNTIYDENKTKCVNENKAEKSCDGEISQKRRVKRKDRIGNIINDPLVGSEKSYGCSTTGYFAFEKEGDCSRGFLKCTSTKSKKLRGLVYQCPENYIFWNISKRCEPLYKVSDCKRSLVNDWSSRWEIPIERQNVAI